MDVGSIGRAFPTLLGDLCALVVGLAGYGALFALAGAALKRPLTIGLVFVFGWEPAVMLLPGYLKRLTISYYLQGLVPHAPGTPSVSGMLADPPAPAVSIVVLAAVTAVALWLAGRAVERREYVLEQ
jgi:hypothetical protein